MAAAITFSRRSILTLAGLALVRPAWAAATAPKINLYISPNGDDNASGINPHLTDKINGPVKSYARVRLLVNAAKNSAGYLASSGVVVNQMGGSYTLDAFTNPLGLQFGAADGGTYKQPIIYQGYGFGGITNPTTVGAGSTGGAVTTLVGANGLRICIRVDGASNMIFRDFAMPNATSLAFESDPHAVNVRFDRCTSTRNGASVSGLQSGITNCHLSNVGNGIGLAYQTGSTANMVMSGCYAINNIVSDISAQTGILLMGPGCTVSNNLIYNSKGFGIQYGDIYQDISFNEIHDVAMGASDAGAIYGGRSWVNRGTKIMYNYIHGLHQSGNAGIYLDDQMSGELVYGNIINCNDPGAKGVIGILVGGGSDNVLQNNVFCFGAASGSHPFYYDDRGSPTGWEGTSLLMPSLQTIPYGNAQWTKAFPTLATILSAAPQPGGIPARNVYAHNVSVGTSYDLDRYSISGNKQFSSWTGQWADQNPILLDPSAWTDSAPAATRFGFDPASAAFAAGFSKLPLTSMGLNPTLIPTAQWGVIYRA